MYQIGVSVLATNNTLATRKLTLQIRIAGSEIAETTCDLDAGLAKLDGNISIIWNCNDGDSLDAFFKNKYAGDNVTTNMAGLVEYAFWIHRI